MRIFTKGQELDTALRSTKGTVALVPTMGALHEGHLHLVEHAARYADIVVATVFVNPTQFNNAGDLSAYPRDPEGDKQKLESAGCDFLWMPAIEEIYPNGVVSGEYDLGDLEKTMEGLYRPGHFQGVATVVDRLFELVGPHVAVFGEKDFQQVAVIRRMAEIRKHRVGIRSIPTVRETSGLAMSSRNRRLTPESREAATIIYRAMHEVSTHRAQRNPGEAKKVATEMIKAAGLQVEYVEIADEQTLQPVEDWQATTKPRIFVAAYAGDVRLIDNMSLI